MKTANIILDEKKYQLEKLSEKTFKIHYDDRPYDHTSSWNVDFMQKTKMVEDIGKWLKGKLEINGNQYFTGEIMKNKEEIMEKINELNSIYTDMDSMLEELIGKQRLSDDKFAELIELIEEPICQMLYFGDYGLWVAWGKDEVNVPQFLVFEDNGYFPVNNSYLTPDIYGIVDTPADAILEYKMSYLEEKFDFFKRY